MGRPYGREYWLSNEYRKSRRERAFVIWKLIEEEMKGAGPPYLDVGAGPGIMKEELSRLVGAPFIGVEYDPEVIVEKRLMIVGDGRRLPIRDNSIGFLLLNHILEHVEDSIGLVSEAYRVLKPGGILYIATPNRYFFYEVHYKLPFVHWLPKRLRDPFIRIFGRGENFELWLLSYFQLEKMLKEAGFVLEDLLPRLLLKKRNALRKRSWRLFSHLLSIFPKKLIFPLLRFFSPQHMIIARKPQKTV
jgi:SAM-dependent methyltransferase